MSYYSNNYLTNNFKYSSSGYPRSSYSSSRDLDNKYSSSSYSNLSSSLSNGRQVSTSGGGGGKSAPTYYMSTYHTSPPASSNATTIIITKKIPDYGSSSGLLDSLKATTTETSERYRSASRDSNNNKNRGQESSSSSSPTRRYGGYSTGSSSSLYGSGYVSSQNKQSYDEFLKSPPVHTSTLGGSSLSATGAGAGGSSSNLNGNKSTDSISNAAGYGSSGNYSSPNNNSNSNRGGNGGGGGNGGDGDVTASAVSNIQLSLTDDLTTQVDYCLNEVDNRMICSGKQVEIESFEFTTKSGLISKCLYINQLLTEAGLSETNLDSDPMFTQTGKVIILFLSSKDAEEFTMRHSGKFNVSFTGESSGRNQRKNVSFHPDRDNNHNSGGSYTGGHQSSDEDEFKKSILRKNESSNNSGSGSGNQYTVNNKNTDLILSANTNKKNKVEGYEILTIRAKLKQRINQNRTKQVTLGDIDSIMRNVVTIIQDEFMKRFPSGPSPAAIAAESS